MKPIINVKEKNMDEKHKNNAECKSNEEINILIKKKKKVKIQENTNSKFRNNYKNYQYDYEEDFYEPKY